MERPSTDPGGKPVDEDKRNGPRGANLQILSGSHGFMVNSLAVTTVERDLHIHHINEAAHPGIGREPTIESQREMILKCLKAPDFHGIYTSTLEQRMAYTGSWFLELSDFETFTGSKGVTLWCTGMPGAGKTILASIAIESLYEATDGCPQTSLAFAFLRYSERYEWKEVLTSLLAQLVKRSDLACATFGTYYDRAAERAASEPSIMESALEEALCNIAGELDRLYVVIDGLDEATDEVKDKLLQTLVPSGVNLLVLSRPLGLYTDHAPKALYVSIQAQTKDIELYVRAEVERSSRLRLIFKDKPERITELCEKVIEQSEGMFLVAKLQMAAIARSSKSISSLFRHLEDLPAGVNAMYDHTLARIRDSEDASIAFRALAWIKYAHSGGEGSLRPACLQHALSFNEETLAFDTDDVTPIPLILSACQGLVKPEGGYYDSLRLIHYTTSEYLKSVALDGLPNPDLLLAQTCLVCMENNREWVLGLCRGDSNLDPSQRDQLSERPLLLYSHLHWARHVSSSRPPDSVFPFIYPYISKHKEYPSFHSIHGSKMEVVSGAHLIAMHNLIGGFDVESAKALHPDLKSKPGGFTPFHFAAKNGRFDTFQLLLSSYAGANLADEAGETVLHSATWAHQTSFVQLLHKSVSIPQGQIALPEGFGFDVNAQDVLGWTPLMVACTEGNETLVRLFSSCKGVNINIQDRLGKSALHHLAHDVASWQGRLEQCDLLGVMLCSLPQVDVEMCDDNGSSIFASACQAGLKKTVKYLLARHGDGPSIVHQTDKYGQTPLMRVCSAIGSYRIPEATYLGLMAVLDILIAHGGSLHARDAGGRTPFLWVFGHDSAESGPEGSSSSWYHVIRPTLMEYLLVLDPALIDQHDAQGRTALTFAALKDDVSSIRAILSHRGDSSDYVNAQDNNGMTALLHGCHRGISGVVAALLESPCVDLYHQCGRGLSAIDWVFPGWYDGRVTECFEVLINAGEWDPYALRKAFLRTLTRGSIDDHLETLQKGYSDDFMALSSLVRGYFTWTLDDNDTILLLVKSTSFHPCRVPVALVLCSLGLLPAQAPFGIEQDGVNCGCFKNWEEYWSVYQGTTSPFDA